MTKLKIKVNISVINVTLKQQRQLRCVHNTYDIEFEAIEKTFENMDDLQWQCKQCKRIFKNAKAIEDHIVLKDCKELKCDTCGKMFKLKQHLIRHVKTCHQ